MPLENEPPTRRLQALRVVLAVLLATALASGCGDPESSRPGGTTRSHVDGTIIVDGNTLVVTDDDANEQRMLIGPDVEMTTANGIAASGTRARVTYSGHGDGATAVAVAPAPQLEAGGEQFVGRIRSVDEAGGSVAALVLEGEDEEVLRVSIAPGAGAEFDLDEMHDRAAAGDDIRVYYRGAATAAQATAWADT